MTDSDSSFQFWHKHLTHIAVAVSADDKQKTIDVAMHAVALLLADITSTRMALERIADALERQNNIIIEILATRHAE